MARLVVYLFGKPKNSNIQYLIDDYTSRIVRRGISVLYFPEKKGIKEYENKQIDEDTFRNRARTKKQRDLSI